MPTPDEAATATDTKPSAGAPWLSVSQAASLLGTSPRTVRRQCAAGQLPARRVGGLWQVEMNTATESDKSAIDRAAKSDTGLKVKPAKSDTSMSDNRPGRTSETDKSASDLTAHLLEEVRFLRATVEQMQRDSAEVRAALREALKQSPKQLTAGDVAASAGQSSTIDASPINRPQRDENNVAANDSPKGAKGARNRGKRESATDWSSIYGQIADELEAQEKNR